MSNHILHICSCFSPRRRAFDVQYARSTNASGLGAVHIAPHFIHLQTLLASTPWIFCLISKMYKQLWARRRACHTTSYTSVQASRLDAVHFMFCMQRIESPLASTPCMSHHILHTFKRSRLDAVDIFPHSQHVKALLASTPCLSQYVVHSMVLILHAQMALAATLCSWLFFGAMHFILYAMCKLLETGGVVLACTREF